MQQPLTPHDIATYERIALIKGARVSNPPTAEGVVQIAVAPARAASAAPVHRLRRFVTWLSALLTDDGMSARFAAERRHDEVSFIASKAGSPRAGSGMEQAGYCCAPSAAPFALTPAASRPAL